MWGFRRASLLLRNKNGLRIGKSHTQFSYSGLHLNHPEKCRSLHSFFYCTPLVCGNAFLGMRGFSSKEAESGSVGSVSGGVEDEDEDEDDADEVVSEPDLSDEEDGDDDASVRFKRKSSSSALFDTINDSKGISVRKAVDKFVSKGNELTREEVAQTIRCFKNLRINKKALELLECLEKHDQFEYDERSYGSRVGLIAKIKGIQKAEDYINTIPDSSRREFAYQSLLCSCVHADKIKKAEQVFQKIRDLGLPVTVFSCNQMIILYKRHDKNKLADVLQLMEKENLKPSITTYKLLIGIKGQLHDTKGIEKILETMKFEGVEPDTQLRFILARHYIVCGPKDKAETVLKEMEGNGLEENRQACRSLITLYAEMGKAEEVDRVWKACESNPRFLECIAAIEAWGKLGRVEEAEVVFSRTLEMCKNNDNKLYTTMLRVYAKNKELKKGNNLYKRMSDGGFRVGPMALNALVKLYVDAGEIEKADLMLMKAIQQNRAKPIPHTYSVIMKAYSRMGDIHNSEKILYSMKEAGQSLKWHQFDDLVEAYINAKKPAYGMKDRMKAENIFANKTMSERLGQIDPFRKKAAWYLVG